MITADQRNVIGKFPTPQDRIIWNEYLVAETTKSLDVEADRAIDVWLDLEISIAELDPGFIRRVRVELVEPDPFDGGINTLDRAATRKTY